MISFQPITVIQLPNYFTVLKKWTIKNTATIIYAQLTISDELGLRRYIPETGTTAHITFLRSRDFSFVQGQGQQRSFSVQGAIEGTDRSIIKFTLTEEQVKNIYPGTVFIELKLNGSKEVLKQNYILVKENTGANC